MSSQHDVIIIGGGISGLTAAYNIKKRHPTTSVVVLEANDRVGGRTQTVPLVAASGSDKWDVGGQWVGGCQTHVMNLLNELNLETYKQYNEGRHVQHIGKKVKTYKGTLPALPPWELLDLFISMLRTHYYQKQIDVHDPCSHPRAEEWDSMTLANFFDKTVYTKGAKETFEAASRTIFGCEANQISFLYFLLYVRKAGDLDKLIEDTENTAQQDRIKLGAQQISLELVSRIGSENIKLSEPVESISQNDAGVTVTTKSGWTGVASRVIMAMPPKAVEKIEFTPQLSRDRMDFMKRMPMGNYTKVVVTYEKAFWRLKGYSGLAVSSGYPVTDCGMASPFSVVYDATTSTGNPALLGFLCGQMSVDWAMKPAKERQNAVLQHLAAFFGKEALTFLDYIEKDWNNEPFAHGGPVSYMGVGGMENFARALCRVHGRLHFAGTETATAWTGYMSGAIQAGERTALEVLGHIRPDVLSAEDKQLLENMENAQKNVGKKKKSKRSFLNTAFSLSIGVAVVSCAVYAVSYYLNQEVSKLIVFP